MIVFDLNCEGGHRFEGWFASSDDFADQQQRGLVACPQCGTVRVTKAPMAPAVPRKGNQAGAIAVPDKPVEAPVAGGAVPAEVGKVIEALARLQAEAISKSRWVGKDFADQSRAMHYGERDAEAIHGQATLKEAQDLIDEGVAVLPLPFPVAAPEDLN